MEKQDILDMLDSLDMQIARGKIDQNTYNELRKKWLEKLQAVEHGATAVATGTLAAPANTPSTPKAEVLACPRCGAPADIESVMQDLSKPVQCLFCDNVFTLQQSQNDAQKLKQELKTWLEQMMVGSGMGGSSNIDVNARRYIFSENLYPALKKDIDRRLEDLENAPEAPMIPFRVTSGFGEYQPSPLLVSIGQGDNQWLKTLSTRVSAQQLQDFAAVEADKQRLKVLQFRVSSLIYYANIARLLSSSSDGTVSYQVVRQNTLALQKEYRAFAQEIVDEGYRSYLVALDSRISGNVLLLDILIPALEQGRSFPPEAALAQLERALTQLTKADSQANACTYNPLYIVPLQQGIQKDIMIVQIFQAIVKCYEVVVQSRPVEFTAFYMHLVSYTRALTSLQSPSQLLGLLQSIGQLLAARSGIAPVPLLSDWSWLDAVVESNRRKPTFGAAETVDVVVRHYHPYWVATLNYAEKKGTFFVSGTGREALILVDATAVSMPVVGHLLVNDPVLPAVYSGINTYNLLDKQLMALPALVSGDMAVRAMKQYTNQRVAELGATNVKLTGIIYLPVAFVRYVDKKGQGREILVGRFNFVNQSLGNTLGQTHSFLQQYGA